MKEEGSDRIKKLKNNVRKGKIVRGREGGRKREGKNGNYCQFLVDAVTLVCEDVKG